MSGSHCVHRRRLVACLGMTVAVFGASSAAAADISDYFKMYYSQQVVGGTYKGPLDFLRDTAAAHANAEQVLKKGAGVALAVVLDAGNGYLRIDGNTGTDQILTMAVYRKADGSQLLVVGSSNCADACIFSVEFFGVFPDRLQSVALDTVVPALESAQFIRPGVATPKPLAGRVPSINYVPAQVGTTLTLKPWYGYETEETMDKATRGAIRDVVLSWDREQGRFVKARDSP